MENQEKDMHISQEINIYQSYKKWYHGENTIYINPKDIILVEPIHLNAKGLGFGKTLGQILENNSLITPVAIRKISDKKYGLVVGLFSFIRAKILNVEQIAAVVTDLSRDQFFKTHDLECKSQKISKIKSKDIYDILDVDDIVVPKKFLESQPNIEKIKEIRNLYEKNNKIDKAIAVRKRYILKDQYIRYLVARELGIKSVLVKYKIY